MFACAGGPRGKPVYPPQRPGCALEIFHTDLPGVPAWDDLGSVEIVCNIDETERNCFNKLRAEACRMGETSSTTCPPSSGVRARRRWAIAPRWRTGDPPPT